MIIFIVGRKYWSEHFIIVALNISPGYLLLTQQSFRSFIERYLELGMADATVCFLINMKMDNIKRAKMN